MLVQVEWLDITGSERPWLELEEAKDMKPARIISVGQLIVDEKDRIVIAGSWGAEGELGNLNCIPREVVQSLQRVALDVVVEGKLEARAV
jgi:hypothetical protein